jgi:MinD superfamily P-loop ATPase
MDESNTENGHAFLVDTGVQKYHLNTAFKFEMERWVEAIVISMMTSRESKLSVTGACKNVAKLVTAFDIERDLFNEE